MPKNNSKIPNKNKQGRLTKNLKVCIYKFQNHSQNWYMRSCKKSSNQPKFPKNGRPPCFFINNWIIYRTIKYFLLKLYLIPIDNSHVFPPPEAFCVSLGQSLFSKNQMIGQGSRVWHKFFRQFSLKCMYIGSRFVFSFPVYLPVQVILPYDCTTITSSNFIGLPQFSWHFETNFGKLVQ